MRERYSLSTEYGTADELYKAILTLDKKRVEQLKANGTTLTENVRNVLENGPGRKYKGDPAFDFWFSLLREIKEMPLTDFSDIAAMLRTETGKPLYYSEAFWLWGNKRCFEPSFFELTLQNFDQKRMSKKRTIKRIIFKDALGCLPICEKYGWLKPPKTRDELIEYANEKGKTEAVAWLLDFKNRTADLTAERKRTEKKLERELNAPPKTAEELQKQADAAFKRMFEFEVTDGEVVITGYKGKLTEVEIPSAFEDRPVTAIGGEAFYPSARYVSANHRKNRAAVTKVVLPDTVRTIGKLAFTGCYIREVVIPASVKSIGQNALVTATAITATVERGSYAEGYCKRNKITYKYTEEI